MNYGVPDEDLGVNSLRYNGTEPYVDKHDGDSWVSLQHGQFCHNMA